MNYLTNIWNEIVTWCHGGIDPTPIHSTDILLVSADDPARVYKFDPADNSVTLLTTAGQVNGANDLAHTDNKLWLWDYDGGGTPYLNEWDITFNPFNAVFNRTITTNVTLIASAGLGAINDSTLITAKYSSNYCRYYSSDISGAIPVNTLKITSQIYRFICGDMMLTTTNKLISIEKGGLDAKQYIVQYDWATGALEIEIDLSSIFNDAAFTSAYGLFEYANEIYIAGLNNSVGLIYKIDKTAPYNLTHITNLVPRINGASQVPALITQHFT